MECSDIPIFYREGHWQMEQIHTETDNFRKVKKLSERLRFQPVSMTAIR